MKKASFLMVVTLFFLLIKVSENGIRHKINGTSYVISQYMPPQLVWTSKQVFFVVACYAFQLGLGACFWNRYIEAYHQLLESPTTTPNQAASFSNCLFRC